ncbi:septation protein A [bacterium]|nr:septation protein A [bacterium]
MSDPKAKGPGTYDNRLKLALEYAPLVLFMLGYWFLKDKSLTLGGQTYSGFIVSTAVFVVVFVISIFGLWRLTGRIAPMQIITLVVVLFMGGLTVWFNDPHFIKMKPTIIYVFFAAALGVGLLQGKSYLRLVMEDALPMQAEGWMILTRRIAVFFAGLAVLNEIVWRNFSDGTWVMFKAVGLTLAMFLFLLTQARLLERYATQNAEPAPKDKG